MSTSTRTGAARPASRRGRRAALALVVVVVVAAASSADIARRWLEDAASQAPVEGTTEVALRDDRFVPASIAVPAGTTVTFTWDDDGAVHDVVFDDGIRSEQLGDGSFERTFTAPGEYAYTCSLHAFMDGRVVVTG
jgi:plastocyanin